MDTNGSEWVGMDGNGWEWLRMGSTLCGKTHTVISGDSCWTIGQANSLTVAQLQSLNPSLGQNCDLTVGQILLLQPACFVEATPCGKTHAVVSGDSCWSVGQANSLTVAQLQSLNPSLGQNCDLTVGQMLLMQPACSVEATLCGKTHAVVSGDSCWSIGQANSLTVAQFQSLNPSLGQNCDLTVGQILLMQPACSVESTLCGKTHTVVSGDSCWSIGEANSLTIAQIQSLNPTLGQNCDLTVGQILLIQSACNGYSTGWS
ncbi:unnamed protein product [Rotaria magnacalcarata]|uniref:LysM domain-containing protein n=1 Tax=Rotaria magnacalcarata TaxID=392030 RepID=A0A814JDF8_9BILA|nr:unnamed protein product [Rotaria magnacalcarata]